MKKIKQEIDNSFLKIENPWTVELIDGFVYVLDKHAVIVMYMPEDVYVDLLNVKVE